MAHAAGHQHHGNHAEHSGENHHHRRISEHDERTPEHWEELYSEDQVWSGNPNQALVAEVGALAEQMIPQAAGNDAAAQGSAEASPRRRALDVGCGEGADSVWLASQGWDVTALDISGAAVAKTLRLAEQSGVGVQGKFVQSSATGSAGTVMGLASAFMDADLPQGGFELVLAMYPVLEATASADAERKLMSLVAPGGTLLFVHHADVDRERALEHGFDPDLFVAPQNMEAAFEAASGEGSEWEFDGVQRRDRHVVSGKGAGHTADLVVRAKRLT